MKHLKIEYKYIYYEYTKVYGTYALQWINNNIIWEKLHVDVTKSDKEHTESNLNRNLHKNVFNLSIHIQGHVIFSVYINIFHIL
jgi:hypothetical protein